MASGGRESPGNYGATTRLNDREANASRSPVTRQRYLWQTARRARYTAPSGLSSDLSLNGENAWPPHLAVNFWNQSVVECSSPASAPPWPTTWAFQLPLPRRVRRRSSLGRMTP